MSDTEQITEQIKRPRGRPRIHKEITEPIEKRPRGRQKGFKPEKKVVNPLIQKETKAQNNKRTYEKRGYFIQSIRTINKKYGLEQIDIAQMSDDEIKNEYFKLAEYDLEQKKIKKIEKIEKIINQKKQKIR